MLKPQNVSRRHEYRACADQLCLKWAERGGVRQEFLVYPLRILAIRDSMGVLLNFVIHSTCIHLLAWLSVMTKIVPHIIVPMAIVCTIHKLELGGCYNWPALIWY
jgi:hypothetical protein